MSAQSRSFARVLVLALLLAVASGVVACASGVPVPPAKPLVPQGEHDPAVWGAAYPEVYRQWLATAAERPAGKSRYKRGFDGGVMYDKLSEFPFMPLLFKGWGFGIDYKEPRGHYYMLIDQAEADPSRVKAGGACLTCKSPYAQDLQAKDKKALFSATYAEAVAMIPQRDRKLGVTCIDCHDTATLDLATRRWTVDEAMAEIGVPKDRMTVNQRRIMVCGQCHCTYSVMKDAGKSVDVSFPWKGGEWGAITVEDIIANLESDPARHEWTQQVTGFKLGFIRHPDVEFYTAGSPHAKAGVACSGCHMAPVGTGRTAVADHDIISPLKRDMAACARCHTASPAELRAKVSAIQDESLANLIDTGYRVASVAKLFEFANGSLAATSGDPAYDEAAGHYRQAFYRLVYMGAENSVGFHNPAESRRILADARAEAAKAEAGLRALLAKRGVAAPRTVPLELGKYLEGRGVRKLGFVRQDYIRDPSGSADRVWSASLAPLFE